MKKSITGNLSDFQTRTQTVVSNLGKYLAQFTAAFSFIDAAYVNSFQDELDAADAFPTDKDLKSDVGIVVEALMAEVKTGTEKLGLLNDYAKIAFIDNEALQNVTGKSEWKKAKQNALAMQNALEVAYNYASGTQVKPALLAANYTQPAIDALQTLSETIKNLIQELEITKKNRNVGVQTRMKLNNALCIRLKKVKHCSRVVFKNDLAMLNLFLMGTNEKRIFTTIIVTAKDKEGKLVKGTMVEILNQKKRKTKLTNSRGKASFKAASYPKVVVVRVEVEGGVAVEREVKVVGGKVSGVEVII